MIAAWPGVPALVTINEDGSFRVDTPEENLSQGSLREQFGFPSEMRTTEQLRVAEEEERSCDISYTNLRLNEVGLPHLGKGGGVLDRIFAILDDAGTLHLPGAVMLSPESTLRQGPVLFVGLNPGGDQASAPATILDNLRACREGKSGWDEDWNGTPGDALLQRRFRQVAQVIGSDPLAIPATNVVFTRSRNVASHRAWHDDRASALAVHRILADTIRPEKLWFMGNPALAGDVLVLGEVEWLDARHKDWTIGHGEAEYAGHRVMFCHTPHLSIWDPTGNEDLLRFAFGLAT